MKTKEELKLYLNKSNLVSDFLVTNVREIAESVDYSVEDLEHLLKMHNENKSATEMTEFVKEKYGEEKVKTLAGVLDNLGVSAKRNVFASLSMLILYAKS